MKFVKFVKKTGRTCSIAGIEHVITRVSDPDSDIVELYFSKGTIDTEFKVIVEEN